MKCKWESRIMQLQCNFHSMLYAIDAQDLELSRGRGGQETNWTAHTPNPLSHRAQATSRVADLT